MDAQTKQFMDLVDCEEWEVKDIPPDRINVPPTYIPPSRQQQAAAGHVIYFGKHTGRKLAQIPRDYLRWMLTVQETKGQMLKAQIKIRAFFQERPKRTKRRRWKAAVPSQSVQPASQSVRQANFIDDLDQEYLDIVRT